MTSPDPPHRHFAECASTNDLARRWALDAADPAPHGAYVTSDFQTAGRGRRGRTWSAAPGESVLVSIVLRPSFPLSEAWTLAFAAGLAVRDALLARGVGPSLKWPNDLLLSGKKVAGVLVETVSTPDGWAAIVGVGINVHQTAFPADIDYAVPPTSLRMSSWHTFDAADLAAAITGRVVVRASQTRVTVLNNWREHMVTGIIMRRGDEEGIFSHIDNDGAARVLLLDGTYARWTTVDGPETNCASVEYNNRNDPPPRAL